jgi:hypothetical protein
MLEQIIYNEYLIFVVKSIAIGFLVIPLLQTISLHSIQIALIKKHSLPMSGMKWKMLIPNIFKTYFSFLLHRNVNFVSCNMSNGHGGFEWRGIFNWKVW